MKKISFIEPASPNIHIFSRFKIPRLGSFLLGSLMKRRGWEVEVLLDEIRPISIDELSGSNLVGISTTTSTAPRAYQIGDHLRKLGLTVIMGGPHVTFFPEEALQHCDFVIRGEGEEAMMRFVDEWESTRNFEMVPNLSYVFDGVVRNNVMTTRYTNLNALPYPDFSLCRDLSNHPTGGVKVIPVQTSRGCPYHCSFCSVTGMFGKHYRYRSTENVIGELRQYDDKRNFIFFCDDNFTDNRRRAKELLCAMIRERFQFQWSTQARVDVAADEDLVQLLSKAKCHTLFIGFESTNPANLKKMRKGQTVDQIRAAIRTLHRHKIHIHGMFVIGFDDDDKESIDQTVQFAKESGITSAQFLVLTPLPGSNLFKEYNETGRILSKDWSIFDTHHVAFRPKKLTPLELQKTQILCHQKFYSIPQILKKAAIGNFTGAALGLYARKGNQQWEKSNRGFFEQIAEV